MDFLLVAISMVLAVIQFTRGEPKITPYQYYNSRRVNNEVFYDFGYAIEDELSGVFTNRWEERQGDKVRGAYSLLEPGGKIRTVDYEVDKNGGFKAVVKTSLPGFLYLSTQQYLKSKELHPQPSPELDMGPIYPEEMDHSDSSKPPMNYHRINAEHAGWKKLFGSKPNYNFL